MKKTIETKIAKNGAVNIYLDGKRVKEENLVHELYEANARVYEASILGYHDQCHCKDCASALSAFNWLIKMGNKSNDLADGSWQIKYYDFKKHDDVIVLDNTDRDFIINDPALKAFRNGEITETTEEVIINDDNGSDEPEVAKFEVGKTYFVILDGQTITAKVEDRTAKMLTATTNEGTRKYHIHETIDAEHINLNGEGLMIWAQCEFTTQNVNAAKAELQADTEPEVDTSEYAINPDAIDIAVDAEIQAANTAKINDLKWEIRYVEGSINDLDKNHIAHFPQDQSLKERRTELVNELDNLNAQLAELLPTEAVKAEIQAANNAEPDTTELSDEEIAEIKRRSQINAIKSRIATYERAIERQYDAELENSLIAAKAQLAEIEPANTHEADHITGIKEEQPMTNREKLLALRKDYIITDRLSANNSSMWYVNGKRSSQVKVWNLLQSYGLTLAEFLAENKAYIKAQADYLYDKIRREVKALDDYTTDRDAVFNLLPDLDELNDVDTTPDKNNVDTLTADIAKYQDAFDAAQKASIADDMKFLDINKDTLMFSYGKLTAVISDRYNSEIRISGRKYFRYRGMIEKRANFLDHMNNEVIAADQRATFDEFKEDYQLETDGDYFKISIFPRFANGTGSYFHATANDFNRALELVELFKTLDLPFDGTIKCNEISGKEYYHHNRDGSEVINPPELKLPANIKDSLQRAMKIALEAYRLYNLKHNQKAANRERECFMICKKALKEVA